jgi:hypothetical protein
LGTHSVAIGGHRIGAGREGVHAEKGFSRDCLVKIDWSEKSFEDESERGVGWERRRDERWRRSNRFALDCAPLRCARRLVAWDE